jgi:excisionase family DNA binding protein
MLGAMDIPTPTRLLTVNEVADALGCGRTLVYELLGQGQLAHIKIGRLTRIPPSEVDRFVRRRMGHEPVEELRPARQPRRTYVVPPTLAFDD